MGEGRGQALLENTTPGPTYYDGFWLENEAHRSWLEKEARRQFNFFRASLNKKGGFYSLDYNGRPLVGNVQELHHTTRLIHSYALGQLAGVPDCDEIIDHGIRYLMSHHHDAVHGGYFWALDGESVLDDRKLAYGHVFVLLAGASAHLAGHPDALEVIDDVSTILDEHYFEEEQGLFSDEWNRDWTPFSNYRGMNANMHGVEALLVAYEATGCDVYLKRAGGILNFFMERIAPVYQWRLPEHYDAQWQVNLDYSGNSMFRPAGTTPGHSFEFARLFLHYWDLIERPDNGMPILVRNIVERALSDAWDEKRGGFIYTLNLDGTSAIRSRYWWPLTEAIGVLAALIKLERNPDDEVWYRRLWQCAAQNFIDHTHGGWFPEIDDHGRPAAHQFKGKPDIYHSLQAALFPLAKGLSSYGNSLSSLKCVSLFVTQTPRGQNGSIKE